MTERAERPETHRGLKKGRNKVHPAKGPRMLKAQLRVMRLNGAGG